MTLIRRLFSAVFPLVILFIFAAQILEAQDSSVDLSLEEIMAQLDKGKNDGKPTSNKNSNGLNIGRSRLVDPLSMNNQQLFVSVYGLPTFESARLNGNLEFSVGYNMLVTNEYHFHPIGEIPTSTKSQLINNRNTNRCIYRECIIFDYEKFEHLFLLRLGLFDFMELGVDIKYTNITAGSLDQFVDSFHRAFDFTEGGRDKIASFRFMIMMFRDSDLVYHLKEEPGEDWGDILWSLGFQLYQSEDKNQNLALRFRYESPQGDPDYFFGNGNPDMGGELSYSNSNTFVDWFAFHAVAGAYKIGAFNLMDREDIDNDGTENPKKYRKDMVYYVYTGFNFLWNDFFAIKSSLHFNTPYYENMTITALASENLQGVFGFSFKISDNLIYDVSISEDLVTAASPDFTLSSHFKYYFD